MRFTNVKVKCNKPPYNIETIQVVFETDDNGVELVFAPLVCDNGNDSEECINCTSRIWNIFRNNTKFIPESPL